MNSETQTILMTMLAGVVLAALLLWFMQSRVADWLDDILPSWLFVLLMWVATFATVIPVSVAICAISGYGR